MCQPLLQGVIVGAGGGCGGMERNRVMVAGMIFMRTILMRAIFMETILILVIVVRSIWFGRTGGRARGLGQGMQRNRLESSLLKQGDRTAASCGKFDGALEKLAGAIRQAQQTIDFPGEFRERLGTAAVLLGQVEVVRYFEDHRDLSGQGASAANILLGDAGAVEPIENAEHAEHAALGAQ